MLDVRNRTGRARSELINRFLFNNRKLHRVVRGIPGLRTAVPLGVRARILDSIRDWNTRVEKLPPLSGPTLEKLRAMFSDDIRALEVMIQRELSSWRNV